MKKVWKKIGIGIITVCVTLTSNFIVFAGNQLYQERNNISNEDAISIMGDDSYSFSSIEKVESIGCWKGLIPEE